MTEENLSNISTQGLQTKTQPAVSPLSNLKNILSQADHVALKQNPSLQKQNTPKPSFGIKKEEAGKTPTTESSGAPCDTVDRMFANDSFLALDPVAKLDELIKAHKLDKLQIQK